MTNRASYLPALLTGAAAQDGAVLDRLDARPGCLARRPALDLPKRIGRLLWGFESGDGSAGVSSLAPREVFYPALRRLVDRIALAGLDMPAEVVVDVVSDPRVNGYLSNVWPDAALLADPATVVTDLDDRLADPGRSVAVPQPAPVGEPLRDRVVIVLGAARSGTTWLHRMLSAHPDLAGTETGETWLFPDIAPLWADDLRAAVGSDLLIASLREFCDVLLDAMRDRVKPAATHVCEKTPATVWRLPMLAALYPDAHYVHVLRDGRDAVVSMAESGFADGDLSAAAHTWVDAVSRVRAGAAELPRFTEIRYEQLLADPTGAVSDLWDWIGLATPKSTAVFDERRAQRITPLEPVGEIGTGKWHTLDRRKRRRIEAVAGPLLSELGYAERA